MAIAELGTSAYATANAASVTTASITPASGSLAVVLCGMGNGFGNTVSLGTVTDTAGGTWTRKVGTVGGGSNGVAEIWVRDIASATPMTVTYTVGSAPANPSGLDIIAKWFSGCQAAAGQTGATVTQSMGAPYQVAITTTTTGSQVFGSLGRGTDPQTLTANASTTILGQVNGSNGDTSSVWKATALTGTPGSITIGCTNTAAINNDIVLWEMLPSAAPTGPPKGGFFAFL